MARLDKIVRGWEEKQPRRVAGARGALAGFCYQFNESLRRFFAPIANGRAPDLGAFERLGDYVTERDDKIEFVQHKRTLRRSNYLKALDEFLVIESFLRDHFPGDRNRVVYRIVTSQVADVDPRNPPHLADARDADTWQQIVAEKRFAGVEERRDPWYALLDLFWERVRNPATLIADCERHVFESVVSGERNVESLGKRLLQAYERDRIGVIGVGNPWLDPRDMMSVAGGAGPVLTGQRPTPRDWREGCFMQRDAYVDRIAGKLQNILRAPESGRQARKVPLIWITGGSGVGKSGLLLATLARALRDEDLDCAWVPGSPPELREVLEKTPQERVIIGIDDLYEPQWRDAEQWGHLAGFVRARGNSMIWIASAPTEYCAAFQQNPAFSGLFEHWRIEVEPLSEPERRDYAQWYVQRTKAETTTITAARCDLNFVLASLRYQVLGQHDVSLEDFTTRLWGRLSQLGIEASMAAALAAIRLGLSAPTSLFDDPRSHDSIAKLGGDYLFLIRAEERPDGSVVNRISTHRRLADELYMQRFRDDGPRVRASHLLTFWKAADTSTRQALIDVVRKKDQQVEPALAFAFLIALGRDLACTQPAEEVFSQLPAWEFCASKRELPAADRREALDWLCRLVVTPGAITPEWMGCAYDFCWPSIAVSESEAARKVRSAARTWLDGHLDAERWSHLWHRIWKLPPDSSDKPALIDLARRWLASHRDHVGWTVVFQTVFEAGIREPWLAEEASAALPVLRPNRHEQHVMRKVAQLPGMLDRVGELWIGRLMLHNNVYLIEQFQKHLTELDCELSVDWIEQVTDRHPDAIGAGATLECLLSQFVWRHLSTDQYRRASRAIVSWLAGHADQPEWNYVWQHLLKLFPRADRDREELLSVGLGWLTGREDGPEWNYVWQRLVELLPHDHSERKELLRTGLAWLAGREDKPEWAHVWRCLIDALPRDHSERKGLLRTGLAWLAGREDKPEWTYVWEKLMSSASLSGEFRRSLSDAGSLWLEDHRQHRGYRAVSTVLRKFGS